MPAPGNEVLDRMLIVINCLAKHGSPLTVDQIVSRTGLTRQRVQRNVWWLTDNGFILRDSSTVPHKHRLSPTRFARLALAAGDRTKGTESCSI